MALDVHVTMAIAIAIAIIATAAAAVATTPTTPTTAAATLPEPSSLLLVVGDVSQSTARVLFQSLAATPLLLDVTVYRHLHGADGHKAVDRRQVTAQIDKPDVVEFANLEPGTRYRVVFVNHAREDTVTFKTFVDTEHTQTAKLVVVSCNRLNEDGDLSHWARLAASEHDREGMIHLGDQIYADGVVELAKRNASLTTNDLLVLMRALYVQVWGHPLMQRILRHGPHWMLPDDHDIVNNYDRELFLSPLRPALEAGRQAFYEYQLALMQPIHVDQTLMMGPPPKAYFSRRLGSLGLYFLDTRMSRTLQWDPDYPALGKEQFDDFNRTMMQWKEDMTVKNIIVFSSVPLIAAGPIPAEIIYFAEKERLMTSADLVNDTVRILDTIAHVHDRAAIVGGDVHMYMTSELCHTSNEVCLKQVLTSGMTRGSTVLDSPKIYIFVLLWYYIFSATAGPWTAIHSDVFLGKNYLVLLVPADTSDIDMRPLLDPELSFIQDSMQLIFELVPFTVLFTVSILSIYSAARIMF